MTFFELYGLQRNSPPGCPLLTGNIPADQIAVFTRRDPHDPVENLCVIAGSGKSDLQGDFSDRSFGFHEKRNALLDPVRHQVIHRCLVEQAFTKSATFSGTQRSSLCEIVQCDLPGKIGMNIIKKSIQSLSLSGYFFIWNNSQLRPCTHFPQKPPGICQMGENL